MSSGGSHIPWGDPDGPAPGKTNARTHLSRLREISPLLLRSAGIVGIAAGIMVVVSNGIWTSDPRSSEASAPATEVAIRDVTEEPAIAAAEAAEGGALVINSAIEPAIAGPSGTAPAPERFAATPSPATVETDAAEPPAPIVVLPEPESPALLPAAAESEPPADAGAAVIAESAPPPPVTEPAAEQAQATESQSDAEAMARARLALIAAAAAATADEEPQPGETGTPIAAPEADTTATTAAPPEPVAAIPDPIARRARTGACYS